MNLNSLNPTERKWARVLLVVVGVQAFVVLAALVYWGVPRLLDLFWPQPANCYWQGSARAWIDENRDGVKQDDEAPFRAVTLYFDLGWGRHVVGAVTDWNGEAALEYSHLDCNAPTLTVYPEVPDGYELTTTRRDSPYYSKQNQVFDFGFAPKPGAFTATQRPPAPLCTIFDLANPPDSELNDLAVTPNGTVWAAGTGIFELLPNATEWRDAQQLNASVTSPVQSITVENDTSVWFAAGTGALHFDSGTWTQYSIPHRGPANQVNSVAAEGERLWLATEDNGLFMLDRLTDAWDNFTRNDGLRSNHVTAVGASPDGSVWVSTRGGTSRLILPSSPEGQPTWFPDMQGGSSFTRIIARPDNKVWFAGQGWPAYFDLASSSWHFLDYPPLGVSIGGVGLLAFAPDSSLWFVSPADSKIYHLLNGPTGNAYNWRAYDPAGDLPPEIAQDRQIQALAIGPYGTVWIATPARVLRCVFPS